MVEYTLGTVTEKSITCVGGRWEMKAAIEIVDLSKVYRTGFWMRQHLALSALTLAVKPGESFGFVGPNGAGKTTTIKILAGLQDATSGKATIFGHPCAGSIARQYLGFLPERPFFYSHLTAREILRFYGGLLSLSGAPLEKRIDELLERTSLSNVQSMPLSKFSKGMLQRVGLCQSIMHRPAVVILDEPMSGLDPVGRALVRDIILQEQQRGATIFFSSHVLSDVESICDRVAILVGGELRGVGTIQELVGEQIEYVDCTVELSDPQHDLESFTSGELLSNVGNQQIWRIFPNEVNAFIDAVRSAGDQIKELTPIRRDLEQVLIEQIKGDVTMEDQ